MTLFDLLFILIVLLSIVILVFALVQFVRKRRERALRTVRLWAVFTGVYFAVATITSFFLPRDVMQIGEQRSFDDWCIAVDSVSSTSSQSGLHYIVSFRLSSSARRIAQRELGIHVYLSDRNANRFDPLPNPSEIPFDVLLQPQESVRTTRMFTLPDNAEQVGLVIAHEGGFPIAWFIIGEGMFRKPPIVYLEPFQRDYR